MLPSDTLSIQLWTTRGNDPLDYQLSRLKTFGYNDVQPFHDQYDDPVLMRTLLDKHGLTARSGHFNLSMFDGDAHVVLDAARVLGMKLVVSPYLAENERPSDVAGWRELGKRMAAIKLRMSDHGLEFAWHNHQYEFKRLDDGSLPIEHLLGDEVAFEIDMGWLWLAGEDPAAWLKRFRGRVPAVHVKDFAPIGENLDEDGMVDICHGVMDWPRLWQAIIDAQVPLVVLEHDLPSSWERFAARSADAVRALAGISTA